MLEVFAFPKAIKKIIKKTKRSKTIQFNKKEPKNSLEKNTKVIPEKNETGFR